MLKRCILHIGTEKTGTTTLQAHLANNRLALEKMGFIYPSSLGRMAHVRMVTHAMDDDHIDDQRKRLNVTTCQQIAAHRCEVEAALKQEVRTAPSDSVLLLSSEHCHSRLNRKSEVQRLRDLLAPYCSEFQIVVYLRPQHELAVSRYSTALRVGFADFEMIPTVNHLPPLYDYGALLDRWSAVFGNAEITPRIYAADEMKNGDVCSDFLDLIGIAQDHSPFAQPANKSLSADAQIFLNQMNKRLGNAQIRGDIARLIERVSSGPSLLPGRREAEQFYQLFAEGNERVRRKWFPHRTSLFEPHFEEYPLEPQAADLSIERAFDLFAALWKEKQKQIAEGR